MKKILLSFLIFSLSFFGLSVPVYADIPTGTLPPANLVCLGDSITAGWLDDRAAYDIASVGYFYAADPANNYCKTAAALARAQYTNLAVQGYYCADLTSKEVPNIPTNATAVLINCGTNDLFKYGGPVIADWDATVAAVQAKAPNARLIFVTLRRMDSFSKAALVHTWNEHVRTKIYTTGACLVELENDPQYYDGTFPDDMHPDLLAITRLGYSVAKCVR